MYCSTATTSAANNSTVALTLLLLVLILAGNWGLRYAVGASIAATVAFNYFFLPPVGTLTIADTQNWVALFAFLGTAIYASHLANRIREESEDATARRRESEMLYRLGRQLLQPENVAQLFNFIPSSVANAFNSPAVTLYIADGDRIYLSDPKRISSPKVAWEPDSEAVPSPTGYAERTRVEIVRDLREAMLQPLFPPARRRLPHRHSPAHRRASHRRAAAGGRLPCRARPWRRSAASIAMSIERAEALENSARSEAAKETERLRTALLDSVTHELRTPLTSIKASITSLLSQAALDEPSRDELLHVIDEESDRLNRLIEQAVEMAQLDAHKVQLEIKPLDVADLIQTAVEQMPRRLARARVPRHPGQHPAPGARRRRLDPEGARQPAGQRGQILAPVPPAQPSPSSSPPTARATCSPSASPTAARASTRWSRA